MLKMKKKIKKKKKKGKEFVTAGDGERLIT